MGQTPKSKAMARVITVQAAGVTITVQEDVQNTYAAVEEMAQPPWQASHATPLLPVPKSSVPTSSHQVPQNTAASSGGAQPPYAEPERFVARNPAFYIVLTCQAKKELEGLHFCLWQDLERQLPGGRLPGSGAKLRRCANAPEAQAAWTGKHGNVSMPRFF
jgi:hypothetical protein